VEVLVAVCLDTLLQAVVVRLQVADWRIGRVLDLALVHQPVALAYPLPEQPSFVDRDVW
jgi:hypothetical protein